MRAALRRILRDSWKRRSALALLLWPVSVVYGALAGLRRAIFQAEMLQVARAAVPVIVVGNVVAGGGGKTPVVMALVSYLGARGLRAGVISRGYGRRGQECREVLDRSLATDVGDEPLLIKQTTGAPVFVAQRRIDAAHALLAAHPCVDLLVSDDGLQHHGLYRDIEICVFDEGGVGNGWLLPAGPLRERWPRSCDFVLYAGRPLGKAGFAIKRTLASHARRSDGSQLALQDLRDAGRQNGAPLWAVAGIAQPEIFFTMLRDQGLTLAGTQALADHADFGAADWSSPREHTLLCTEKDAVKLWRRRPDALAVPLVVEIEPAFWQAFDTLLSQRSGAKLSSSHGHTPT